MISKIDKIWIGLITGFVVPLIGFAIIYFINKDDIAKFGSYFIVANLHVSAFTVGVIPNLLIFYLSLNRKIYQFGKGVMLLTFVYLIGFLITYI